MLKSAVRHIFAFIVVLTLPSYLQGQSKSELIKIGVIRYPYSGVFEIARAHSFFQNEGVNVELVKYSYGKEALEALIRGEVHMAHAFVTPIVSYILSGADLHILTAIHRASQGTGVGYLKSSGIDTTEEILKRKIGFVPTTSSEYFLHILSQRYGIAQKSLNLVSINPDYSHSLLKNREVDALVVWNPIVSDLHEKIGEDFEMFYLDIYTEYSALVTNSSLIQAHSREIQKVVNALVKAENYYKSDRQRILTESCPRLESDENFCKSESKNLNRFGFYLGLTHVFMAALSSQAQFWMENNTSLPKGIDLEKKLHQEFIRNACSDCVTLYQ